MNICTIETSTKTYPVVLGECLQELQQFLAEKKYSNILIITDDNVAKLHLNTVEQLLENKAYTYTIPHGETGKSFSVYYDALTAALEYGLDRKSAIVALGGGVVGDLAGFVAASYMRGIAFIQVPTTILAHDSAVGGKVGINHELGKNMIGAFYQPEGVFYHIPFLHTLSLEEVRSGFAEVIKHGLIAKTPFFHELQEQITSLEQVKNETWQYFLQTGIEVKAAVVQEDEKEHGVRGFLNFGHTLGHAIEKHYGYRHGEAVAIGMVFAMWLSEQVYEKEIGYQTVKEYVNQTGFPSLSNELPIDAIMNYMKRDKKSTYGDITFVLLEEIGKPAFYVFNEKQLEGYITKYIEEELQQC